MMRSSYRKWIGWTWGILLVMASATCRAGCDGASNLKGVNLAGAEFNGEQLPGVLYKNYIYPRADEIAYFSAQGANTLRLPFLWERIQPTLFGELDPAELQQIAATVALAKVRNLCVILDVHNYGNYRGKPIGSPQVPVRAFVDLWSRLANRFDDASVTAFGLMNEPVHVSVDQWAAAAQRTVHALRKQHSRNLILVSGGRWSGVHDWFSVSNGISNATAFATFRDPEQRTLIEVHQYADANYSGTGQTCIAAAPITAMFDKIANWASIHGQHLFLGEFGVPANPACMAALDVMLAQTRNPAVWRGWTYWAAGQWWGDYALSIAPRNGQDAPQLAVIKQYLDNP